LHVRTCWWQAAPFTLRKQLQGYANQLAAFTFCRPGKL